MLHTACSMLHTACCMSHAACSMQHAPRSMQHAACCTPHAACCTHAVCCMPHAARSMQHAAHSTQHAACCMLPAARCTLHAARCTLHAARCMLHAACCMLHVACAYYDAARRSTPLPHVCSTVVRTNLHVLARACTLSRRVSRVAAPPAAVPQSSSWVCRSASCGRPHCAAPALVRERCPPPLRRAYPCALAQRLRTSLRRPCRVPLATRGW